jgi:hypothetical protein
LTGCKRRHGSPIRRKSPLPRADLVHVVSAYLTRTSHDDLLFLAQLLTGFSALLHLGELTVPDNPYLRSSHKISPRHLATVAVDSISFLLPAHKADRFFEGNKIVVCRRPDSSDPYAPLTAYLRSRDRLHPYHPQLWLLQSGSSPSRTGFLPIPHLVPQASVRALPWRVHQTVLARRWRHRRWASNTFQIYIRKTPSCSKPCFTLHLLAKLSSHLPNHFTLYPIAIWSVRLRDPQKTDNSGHECRVGLSAWLNLTVPLTLFDLKTLTLYPTHAVTDTD